MLFDDFILCLYDNQTWPQVEMLFYDFILGLYDGQTRRPQVELVF